MNATIFKITEKRAHDRQNDRLKLAKQVNKLWCSYYRQGRMKNPLQKPYPRYYSYFTIRLMTKQCLIWNYAVKVRRRELRPGGNKLSAARGLRRII
jgi:hypothetical protein